jgi:hypothetical protein
MNPDTGWPSETNQFPLVQSYVYWVCTLDGPPALQRESTKEMNFYL